MANVSESKANFIHGLSDLWTRFFKDKNQLEAMYKATEITIGQTYLDLMALVLNFSLREVPVFQKEFFKLITVREDLVTLRPSDGRYEFELTGLGIKGFSFLYNKILDPTVILEEFIHFEVSTAGTKDLLIFEEDPFDYDGTGEPIPGIPSRDVRVVDADGNTSVETELAFWTPDTQIDGYDMYLNFGHLVSRFEPSSEAYRALLQGIFQYFVMGPTPVQVTSALNVIVGFPVIRDDGEILQEVDTSDADYNVVVTDVTRYSVDSTIPLREDVLDENNWATNVGESNALTFKAFEYLTGVFYVYDVIENPTWWRDKLIPENLLPDEPKLRRLIDPILHENVVGNPSGLVKVGDPGVICGADDDGYIPVLDAEHPTPYTGPGYEDNTTLWRPTYRHSFPYTVFERFLKHHAYIVEMDHDTLQAGEIPFSRLNFDLQSIIVAGKSAYTYMYAEPGLNFFDDVIPSDELMEILVYVGFTYVEEPDFDKAGLGDMVDGIDNTIIVGETAVLVGDYYKYNVSGAIDVSNAPWPEPLPDANGNTPVVVGGADPTHMNEEWRSGTGDGAFVYSSPQGSLTVPGWGVMENYLVGTWVYRPSTQKYYQIASYAEIAGPDTVIYFATPIYEFTDGASEDWSIWTDPAIAGHGEMAVQLTVTSPVWVGGSSIYYWDGLTRATQRDVANEEQRSIDAYIDSPDTDVHAIAVGDLSNVPKTHHWDGNSWSEETNPLSDGTLYSVITPSNVLAIACGYDDIATAGKIITWNGSAWSAATISGGAPSVIFTSVLVVPGTGEQGAVGYLDGGATRDAKAYMNFGAAWADIGIGADDHQFLDSYAPDNVNIWCCGSDYPGEVGSVHYFDGASPWVKQYDGTSDGVGILNSIWGTDLYNIWTVGEDSAVIRWDGISWAKQSFPVAGLELTSIWGHSTDNMYIVGFDGTDRYIFQTKDGGTTWITRDSDTTADEYYAVAGVSP